MLNSLSVNFCIIQQDRHMKNLLWRTILCKFALKLQELIYGEQAALKPALSVTVSVRSGKESVYLWLLILSSVSKKHFTYYKALINCFEIQKSGVVWCPQLPRVALMSLLPRENVTWACYC